MIYCSADHIYFSTKKILSSLASIPPGELNIHSLSKNINLDYKTIFHYITILDETKLAQLIYPQATGNPILRKLEKFFINNTTLLYALNKTLSIVLNSGMERELFFCQALKGAQLNCFYSKQGDFTVNDTSFEIGGKNKRVNQNQSSADFIVKDNCWISSKSHSITLFWIFVLNKV